MGSTIRRIPGWLGAALAAGYLGAWAAGPGPDAAAEPLWGEWSALRLKTRGRTFLTGSVELRLRREADTARLETHAVARLLGARMAASNTLTILDAATGRPRRCDSFNEKRARRYVFGPTGYRVERLAPPAKAGRPLDEWRVTSTREFPYPTGPDGATLPVFDYYGMLLHLARLELHRAGDEVVIHVATARGPLPYRVHVGESTSLQETIHDMRAGKRRTQAVRQLRLRITPADPSESDEGFLRMEGETELWVEAGSKTLLRVSGKVPKVPGRVVLALVEIG